ncbi:hypothetical protein EMGR_008884 [Emarellia grisea]
MDSVARLMSSAAQAARVVAIRSMNLLALERRAVQSTSGIMRAGNPERPCDVVLPENINVKPWTHLYYSFAGIDPSDFTITTTHDNDADYWEKFTALKQKKSTLKTYISVGG